MVASVKKKLGPQAFVFFFFVKALGRVPVVTTWYQHLKG